MAFILNKNDNLRLTKQIYTPENDKYLFHFSKEFDKEVELQFSTMKGEKVSLLEKNKIYFISTLLNGKEYFLYRGYNENNLFGSCCSDLDGRLFIFLPNSTKGNLQYTSESNLNGTFFISGATLQNASLAEFNSKASDIVFLTNSEEEDCEKITQITKN